MFNSTAVTEIALLVPARSMMAFSLQLIGILFGLISAKKLRLSAAIVLLRPEDPDQPFGVADVIIAAYFPRSIYIFNRIGSPIRNR